jgi:hypothetical protein
MRILELRIRFISSPLMGEDEGGGEGRTYED